MGTKISQFAGTQLDAVLKKSPRIVKTFSSSEEGTRNSSENVSYDSPRLSPSSLHLDPTELFQYRRRPDQGKSSSDYSVRLNSPSSYEVDTGTMINELLSLCESGSGSAITDLLEHGEIPEEFINSYHDCYVGDRQMNLTPLMLAAACGHPHIIVEFLASRSVFVNARSEDMYGQTALHIAVSLGQLKCIEVLAAHANVDINATDTMGMTPLHLAAYGNYDEAIELLLEGGESSCEIQDSNGNNVFHIGAMSNNVSAIKLIIRHAAMVDFGEICRYGDTVDLSDSKRPAMGEALRHLTEAVNNDGCNVKMILQQNIANLKMPPTSYQPRPPNYLELCDDANRCFVLYTRATYYPSVLRRSGNSLLSMEENSPSEDVTAALSWSPRAVLRENGSYMKICSPLSH